MAALHPCTTRNRRRSRPPSYTTLWGTTDGQVRHLFTSTEYAELLRRFEHEVIPCFEQHIDEAGSGWDSDTRPEERFRSATDAVDAIRQALPDDPKAQDACEAADEYISDLVYEAERGYSSPYEADEVDSKRASVATAADTARDQFDDVADGH